MEVEHTGGPTPMGMWSTVAATVLLSALGGSALAQEAQGATASTDPPRAAVSARPAFLDIANQRVERPTAEQIAALREMEAAAERFAEAGRFRRDAVRSFSRRGRRQRGAEPLSQDRAILEEDRQRREARARTIQQLEALVRRHPADPSQTPDALVRLGELYFARSVTQERPSFTPTIEVYRRLLRQFPESRRRDGVLYLLGYCLQQMGALEEALQAWTALVCAKRVTYDPDQSAAERAAVTAPDHEACEAVTPDSRLVAETYVALAQVHFDGARYSRAIELWRLVLAKWPHHRRAPQLTHQIQLAFEHLDDREQVRAVQRALSTYGPQSDWWIANMDDPAEQREAARLAEDALVSVAIHQHQLAQKQRRECVERIEAGDEAEAIRRCQTAERHYGIAADHYRTLFEQYPDSPHEYELRYNRADALYWSERYEEAAVEYAAVRDSPLGDAHRSEAARRAVESLKRVLEDAVAKGRVTLRENPPERRGSRVHPVEMPELLQRVSLARELYVMRVSEESDTEGVRAAYEYNNALTLYWYGYWPEAKARFERIFEERCNGPNANETGLVAWENLRAMAIATGQRDRVERLTRQLVADRCSFDPNGSRCHWGRELVRFCARNESSNHSCCLEGWSRMWFLEAVQSFDDAEHAESRGDAAEAERLYLQAATQILDDLQRVPDHEDAPIALEKAATALERTQRFDAARRLYERIIDEVGEKSSSDPERQTSLDRIMAHAHFQVAYDANRGFHFEEALRGYRMLADTPRFARSTDHRVQEFWRDAQINLAVITERLQRYDEATQRYRGLVESPGIDAHPQRLARYRIAEIANQQGADRRAIESYRALIERHGSERDASELVVMSYRRIAQIYERTGAAREHQAALREVVRAGRRAGAMGAEYAAEAAFMLADQQTQESFAIDPGRPRTLEDYVDTLKRQIDAGAARVETLAERYDRVRRYRSPTWTVAALAQQGRLYERFAERVLAAPVPFVLPADVQQRVAGQRLTRATRAGIRRQIEDTVRELLEQRTGPIECLAITHHVLAVREARSANLDTPHVQNALDRLQVYTEERIRGCIAQARRRDAGIAAYRAGEFARARRGLTLPLDADIGPPALETLTNR